MGKLNTLKNETDQLYTDILKIGELKWNWNWILSANIVLFTIQQMKAKNEWCFPRQEGYGKDTLK